MTVSYKIKVFLHLIFPLLIFLLLFLLISSTVSNNDADVVEKVANNTNTSDGFKVFLFNYVFFALPHYIIWFLSLIIKTIKAVLLYLMSAANITLIGSTSCIVFLKYLGFIDLSLLWIFYWPISLIIILLTLLIVKKKPNKT